MDSLLLLLWLIKSFRVNAITGNCYRLPSKYTKHVTLHLIPTVSHLLVIWNTHTQKTSFTRRLLLRGRTRGGRQISIMKNPNKHPYSSRAFTPQMHASLLFNDIVYSNVLGSGEEKIAAVIFSNGFLPSQTLENTGIEAEKGSADERQDQCIEAQEITCSTQKLIS